MYSNGRHAVFVYLSLSLSFPPQRMADSGAWQRVNTQVPIRSPRYAVFDLAEGKQYQFRALSANIYGNSEPSEPTGPIQTQELKGVFLSVSLYHYTDQKVFYNSGINLHLSCCCKYNGVLSFL